MLGREYAYRVLWERKYGPLPAGVGLHHRCERTWCVNLAHLEPLTQAEHIAEHRPRRAPATSCPAGHAYTDESSYFDADGYKHCRICRAEKKRARRRAEGRPERIARRRI